MLSKKIIVGPSDVDNSLLLRLSSLLKYTQDISVEAVENSQGVGKKCRENNLLWIIARTQIEINRLPKYLESIVLKTYPGPSRHFIYPRHYVIESSDGEVLIRMISLWFLIDSKTRRPTTIPNLDEALSTETYIGELPFPARIEKGEGSLLEKYKVLYTDIDLNGHMNNVRYIDLVLNLFTSKEIRNRSMKKININYSKEVYEGNTIELYGNISSSIYVEGKIDEERIFEIKIE